MIGPSSQIPAIALAIVLAFVYHSFILTREGVTEVLVKPGETVTDQYIRSVSCMTLYERFDGLDS